VPLEAPWHARILGSRGPVGAGVLVDPRRIITCAHVVMAALERADPGEVHSGTITVDFPQCVSPERRTARVVPGGWFPGHSVSGTGDLAMLEILGDDVQCAPPARLRCAGDAGERVFGVLGHPAGYPEIGNWAKVRLVGRGGPGREWIQVESAAAIGGSIRPGFSGAGLLDETDGTVIGCVVAAERVPQDRIAWMIPIEVICGYWPWLRPLLAVDQVPGEAAQPDREIVRLADLMLGLRGIAVRADRDVFIAAMARQFGGRLAVLRADTDEADAVAFVSTCRRHPGALHELVERLRVFHTADAAERSLVAEIAVAVEVLDPAPLLRPDMRNTLYRLLSELETRVTSDMVRTAYREAAGELSPVPITPHDVPSVIRVLESATLGPDGLPPLLGFLEALARQLPGEHADGLHRWVDGIAQREGIPRHLISAIRLSTRPASRNTVTGYLLTELRDYGADDTRYLSQVRLLQGRRDGRLPRGQVLYNGDAPLTLGEIPARFDAVLSELWTMPDLLIDELVVEFLMPLRLLGLPVDQWQVRTDTLAHPLCAEYHVVVRYRDRQEVGRAHGRWRTKTQQLRDGNREMCWVDPDDETEVHRLYTKLLVTDTPFLAMLRPPAVPGPLLGSDAISAGIWAGVPVMIWCRDSESATSFADLLRAHLSQPRPLDLPALVRQVRGESFKSDDAQLGAHITLIWDLADEPTSLVSRFAAPG